MKPLEARLVAALRSALDGLGWVSAFSRRETEDGPAYVVDHHGEDGDERRTLLTVEGFEKVGPGRDDEDRLAWALNREGRCLRAFGDEDDATDWGRLETPEAEDEDDA